MNGDGDWLPKPWTLLLLPRMRMGKNTGGTKYTKNEHGPTRKEKKTKFELQGKKENGTEERLALQSAKIIWKTEKLL